MESTKKNGDMQLEIKSYLFRKIIGYKNLKNKINYLF